MSTYVHIRSGVHVRARDGRGAMRLASAQDLGLYIRDRRRRLGMTQASLSVSAQVSRRWLSDLEAGKPTAEIGLIFKVLQALELILEASPYEHGPDEFDLDDALRAHGRGPKDTGRG